MRATTAIPIRVHDGFLKRCDPAEAIVRLLEVMARTPHGSWPGSPHFGLRDLFENARRYPESRQFALQELRQALADLGLNDYKVESIQLEEGSEMDRSTYTVVLEAPLHPGERRTFRFRP
ncbi:MAG TPA: hypothetical protein VE621_09040 [Bryobacteraceae bacterium]|jgi:hypothetical protein|nr:hypothetical protein [Bryobacteraceae bacterium]